MGKRSTFAFFCLAMLCMVSNGSKSIKEFKTMLESCGPPFKVWFEPDPVMLGVVANGTLVLKAVHNMLMGTMEAYFNVWPYHVKTTYCEDGTTAIDPKGCYIKKGETRTFSGVVAFDESIAYLITEPILYGNITIHNEHGELMLCARGNATVVYN